MMMDLPEQAERRQEHRGADFGKHDVGKFCPGASAVHGRYQAQDGLARGGQDVLLVCTPPRPQPTPSTLSAFVHSQIVPTQLQAGCARLRLRLFARTLPHAAVLAALALVTPVNSRKKKRTI
jgi:hypothetical protein